MKRSIRAGPAAGAGGPTTCAPYGARRSGQSKSLPGPVGGRLLEAAVTNAGRGDHAAARRALQEAAHDEVGLVDVHQGVGLLAQRHRQRVEANRSAVELLHDRQQDVAVELVEPFVVDLEQVERGQADLERDRALMAYLGEVAHAAQQAVGDARRAARTGGELGRRLVVDRDPEDACRAPHDRGELVLGVVLESLPDAEAVAQRRGEQSGARGRADQREGRHREADAARRRPLADHDVDLEILHGG